MYSVVEFFNDKSVAEVPEAWFYNAGSVLWPKKHRQRRILLENNQRPPDGTKAYAVKVLKSGLTLEKARQAARRALNTDNLSSSEPRQLGRGKRIRRIRELTSDSDDEISPNQPREPSGWPAPPPILQPRTEENLPHLFSTASIAPSQSTPLPSLEHSTAISSYVSTATISTEFSQQVQKDMADIKGQLINTNVRLAALERRNDFLAEQLMALHSSVQQMQATLSDVVNALQRASSAGSVTSSSLNLPLCTEEAYENFLRRLSVEDGFANEAVRQLAMVGGRNEADFLRNLLTVLLGPPLCHNFCWAGGSKEKNSFMACPLFSVLKDAIAQHPRFGNCTTEIFRRTAIRWFHGSQDQYGGRSTRRRSVRQTAEIPTPAATCPQLSPAKEPELPMASGSDLSFWIRRSQKPP